MSTIYESRTEARRSAAGDLTCRNCGHLAGAHVPDGHGRAWCPTTAQLVAQLRTWRSASQRAREPCKEV